MQGEDSQPFLTKEIAQFRSKHIQQGSIIYDIGLNVLKGDYLKGCVQITFNLLSEAIIPLDFRQQLLYISVNGIELTGKQIYSKQKIQLRTLKIGTNIVYIEYLSKYSYDRCGCKTFTDTLGKQYITTCFEPWEANRLFPNFDQPNLKANFKFQAIIPQSWIITSGTNKLVQEKDSNFSQSVNQYLKKVEGSIHKFQTTQLLPTYLFNFAAGQYFKLERDLKLSYKGLNTSLYCHQSMAPYLQKHSALLWQMTDQGLKFYEQFFGYQYPFSKFQVLFFANFEVRAMQNPGLIVFEDNYLFKQDVGQEMMVDLAQTFLHQMAHCWFGNLTTMLWWDDLWLNQSFADYMGFFCLEKIKDKITSVHYQTAMISYFRRKWWGYKQDSYSINHPVRATINNTDQAMSLFDGITYSKGGSVLKSIVFLIGQDKFSSACKDYFNKFAWKNTKYSDFTQCLQKYFDIKQFDLQNWSKQWLDTKGHNSLKILRNGEGKLTIKQRCLNNCDILKSYKINLSYWKNDIKTTKPIIVTNTFQTVIETEGQYFLLNDQDHCFVNVELDDQSFNYFSKRVSKIDNSLTRTMLWTIFYQRIKYGDLSIQDFIKIVIDQIPLQNNVSVIQCTLQQVSQLLNNYVESTEHSRTICVFLLNLLQKISDAQKRKIILSCILSTKCIDILNYFLSNKLGDNISQKLQIASVLVIIAPQKEAQISKILQGSDLSNVAQQFKKFNQMNKILSFNDEQKTQYFFSKILNESSTKNRYEIFGECKLLKQNKEWYQNNFNRYIQQLPKRVVQSKPARQQHFSFVLKGFKSNNVTQTELSLYKGVLEKVNNRFFFSTILRKFIEDNQQYLKIRTNNRK